MLPGSCSRYQLIDPAELKWTFKREVDLKVVYKRYGEFRAEDLEVVNDFWKTWLTVQHQELALLDQRLHGEG